MVFLIWLRVTDSRRYLKIIFAAEAGRNINPEFNLVAYLFLHFFIFSLNSSLSYWLSKLTSPRIPIIKSLRPRIWGKGSLENVKCFLILFNLYLSICVLQWCNLRVLYLKGWAVFYSWIHDCLLMKAYKLLNICGILVQFITLKIHEFM